jgi:tRNA (guanine-N7-)-methyltransferase
MMVTMAPHPFAVRAWVHHQPLRQQQQRRAILLSHIRSHPTIRWQQCLRSNSLRIPDAAAAHHQSCWKKKRRLLEVTLSSQRREDSSSSSPPPPPGIEDVVDPWSHPRVDEQLSRRRRGNNNKARFRQHVNPLARRYQQPCVLPMDWPASSFLDVSRPLHLDIGCGKGGFLIDLAIHRDKEARCQISDDDDATTTTQRPADVNYLGLEIRPLVAQYARERLAQLVQQQCEHDQALRGRVDFLGCNVNVDLDRILTLYSRAADTSSSPSDGYGEDEDNKEARVVVTPWLETVTIHFPDPHFKSHHAKRRVVNPHLVRVLACHLRRGTGRVFLQSDVRPVLTEMLDQFAAFPEFFRNHSAPAGEDMGSTRHHNVFGVPTERETSVLERGLPVYRAFFERTRVPYHHLPPAVGNNSGDDNTRREGEGGKADPTAVAANA